MSFHRPLPSTSSEFADQISDETGTNLTVFSDSPTLVTPALGTPSSIDLTNATNLPSHTHVETDISDLGTTIALVSDNLGVFATGGSIELDMGSEAAPAVAVGASGHGMYFAGSALRVSISGSQAFNVSSTSVASMSDLTAVDDVTAGDCLIGQHTQLKNARSDTAWGTAGAQQEGQAATFTDTSSSGTVPAVTSWSIGQPTFAASNPATIYTDAASLYIADAPAAGTNASFTNPWALWVDAGASRFDGQIECAVGTGHAAVVIAAKRLAQTE